MTREQILKKCKDEQVKFMRLQFSDILGQIKNVEVPETQFEKALEGQIMFDGSSIHGFSRIEESDQVLEPELSSFAILPWDHNGNRTGRLVCDVKQTNGDPFPGDPRTILKNVCNEAAEMGFKMVAGPEPEFFLFLPNAEGDISLNTHDRGGYFDMAPVDKGEAARRDIVEALIKMGFDIEASHHEVAHGQHEIDFKYDDAVTTADKVSTFRLVVRKLAHDHGLHATFMPKPIFGINGSGMHVHMSLFKGEANAFYDANAADGLSATALSYIAGLIKHAKAFVAITNPLINSYKRLVPGFEAPTNIAWSMHNRSPMIRIPNRRGNGTRTEVRMPDPSCNPYLAFAVMLKAGLDGIKNNLTPPPAVNENIFSMSERRKRSLKIDTLPGNLHEALVQLEKSKLMREALGEHVFNHFLEAKHKEWADYISQVHQWEVDRYLGVY
jgi:glutamine synthetase